MIKMINNKKISISDKNTKAFEKMHGTEIKDIDIKAYLMAYYIDMKYEEIINTKTADELEKAIDHSIMTEAIDCFGMDFYHSI